MKSPFLLLFFLSIQLLTTSELKSVTLQAYNVQKTATTCNSVTVSWNRGDGGLCMVTCRELGTNREDPVDSIGYSANKVFGFGADLNNGNYCVYVGNDSTVAVTGLAEGKTYIFQVYELDYDPFIYLRNNSPSVAVKTNSLSAEIGIDALNRCQSRNKVAFKAITQADYPITGIQWTFVDATVTADSLVYHLPQAGMNKIRLTLLPTMGCKREVIDTFVFIYPGVQSGTINQDSLICSHKSQEITANVILGSAPGTSFTWQWTLDSSEIYHTKKFIKFWDSSGYHHAELVVFTYLQSNFTGCSDTLRSRILVTKSPVFQFSGDTCFTKGNVLMLTAPVLAKNYIWNGISGSQTHVITDTGYTWLRVMDSSGCDYSDTIRISYCPDAGIKTDLIKNSLQVFNQEHGVLIRNSGVTPRNINIVQANGQLAANGDLPAKNERFIYLKPGFYILYSQQLTPVKFLVY